MTGRKLVAHLEVVYERAGFELGSTAGPVPRIRAALVRPERGLQISLIVTIYPDRKNQRQPQEALQTQVSTPHPGTRPITE
jgi:hypothetical protein